MAMSAKDIDLTPAIEFILKVSTAVVSSLIIIMISLFFTILKNQSITQVQIENIAKQMDMIQGDLETLKKATYNTEVYFPPVAPQKDIHLTPIEPHLWDNHWKWEPKKQDKI